MYTILVNNEGQLSLWPSILDAPNGWGVVFEKAPRQQCLNFVEENWTDIRPQSLAAWMDSGSSSRPAGDADAG
jgi:MbtH protein